MTTLVHIPYSPWSRDAGHALQAHGVAHRRVAYVTMLSDPWLRWSTGRWIGRLEVPILIPDDGPVVSGSLAIARWAAARSASPLLVGDEHDLAARWRREAEGVLAAGRLRATHRVLTDRVALAEHLPAAIRRLGPLGMVIGTDAAHRLLVKYATPGLDDVPACTERMAHGLSRLEEALADGPWVGDRFSWADVVASSMLAFVAPRPEVPLGPASRAIWSDPTLADAHPRCIDHAARVDRALAERSMA